MAIDTWYTLLASHDPIVADGAMGTMLMEAGLTFGDSPEAWNVMHPDVVRNVHRQYINAGAQILLTNTFGGSAMRLKFHGLEGETEQLNIVAAQILLAEIKNSGFDLVAAGNIGPTGELFSPMGELTFSRAQEAFQRQAAALIKGGVDVIWIETMYDLTEAEAAVAAVKDAAASLAREIPIIVTFSFDTRGCTMMGLSPSTVAGLLPNWEIAAFGANCGNEPDALYAALAEMKEVAPDAVLVAKSNAGIPFFEHGRVHYPVAPEGMARHAALLRDIGSVRIIGGCCGNTPSHIAAICTELRTSRPHENDAHHTRSTQGGT